MGSPTPFVTPQLSHSHNQVHRLPLTPPPSTGGGGLFIGYHSTTDGATNRVLDCAFDRTRTAFFGGGLGAGERAVRFSLEMDGAMALKRPDTA